MCTAITYKTDANYFGRNFDYDISYGEKVVVTPRNFQFKFRKEGILKTHYAFIGVAAVIDNYPLYYDATNEKGLSIAGLNFPQNAFYGDFIEGKINISPFELIPWLLGNFATIKEARESLENLNLVNINFNEQLPLSPLHWMISDKNECIVVESVKDGLKIYDNPIGVMTNSPTFDYQMFNLNNYHNISTKDPKNLFSEKVDMNIYSRGMGGIGMPGDLSSMSRFVKAAFTKLNSVAGHSEDESVSQFFHILGSVEQQNGLCDLGNGKYEKTIYSSCCNIDEGIYYYKTYNNSQINAVDMNKENLDSSNLCVYPLINEQNINLVN